MATIAENLQTIKDSTEAIKQAIIDKGVTISGGLTTYADAIKNISGGGGSGGGNTSSFRITNKLNGYLFGGPNYSAYEPEFLHKYNFEGGVVDKVVIIPDDFSIQSELILSYPLYEFVNPSASPYFCIFRNNKTQYASISGIFDLYLNIEGQLYIQAGGFPSSEKPITLMVVVFDDEGNYDHDYIQIQTAATCFSRDTKITLFDNSQKKVQDVTYNDELKVWDFDNGATSKAKPLWIKKQEIATYYYRVTLEDGNTINLVGSNGKCHRLFNYDDMVFESATDMVGKNTYTENGICKVVSVEKNEEVCEYYNIITNYHMNCFANGILSSCRYNNLYPIKDMKFIKDDRLSKQPRWKIYADKFRQYPVLGTYLDGLRLYEQEDISIEDTVKYVNNLELLKKRLTDFDENYTISNDISEANVGWIDLEGNVYGFKLYMPGQLNHILLADIIGSELGLKEEPYGGYSRTLENLGWVKFSNDFLSYSNKKEITTKQERMLFKFLHNNEKVKKRGSIKMGSILGDDNSLEYLKLMPIKDLTSKMRGN